MQKQLILGLDNSSGPQLDPAAENLVDLSEKSKDERSPGRIPSSREADFSS
jgi:hypothetical protein